MENSQTDSNVSWFKCTKLQKPNLAPLPVSKYDSTTSPTAIPDPVFVYNFGRLCIQWCQNRDGRATVGLCTVCAHARLDTAHSTIRLHWVTEDMCVCYSLTECYRPKSAGSLCGITERRFLTLTAVCSAILIAVCNGLLFIITQYINTSGIYCISSNWKNLWRWYNGAETFRRLIFFTNCILLIAFWLMSSLHNNL